LKTVGLDPRQTGGDRSVERGEDFDPNQKRSAAPGDTTRRKHAAVLTPKGEKESKLEKKKKSIWGEVGTTRRGA